MAWLLHQATAARAAPARGQRQRDAEGAWLQREEESAQPGLPLGEVMVRYLTGTLRDPRARHLSVSDLIQIDAWPRIKERARQCLRMRT